MKTTPVDAILYSDMIKFAGRALTMCQRQMDELSRRTHGERIVNMTDEMLLKYVQFSDAQEKMNDEEKLEIWNELRKMIDVALTEIQIVASLKIWKMEKAASLGEEAHSLRARIDQHINHQRKKIEKAKKEDNEQKEVKKVKRGGKVAEDGGGEAAAGKDRQGGDSQGALGEGAGGAAAA